jgi:hypothetical protein
MGVCLILKLLGIGKSDVLIVICLLMMRVGIRSLLRRHEIRGRERERGLG